MKTIMRFLLLLFICIGFAQADTETINWYVGDTLYTTTTCQSGDDVILPTPPTKEGYIFRGWQIYTPVEYLESTGTQYINTGIIADQTTEAEIEFEDFSLVTLDLPLFMATSNGWVSSNFGVNMSTLNVITFYMNCDGMTDHAHVTSGNIKLLLTGIYLNGVPMTINRGQIPSSGFTTYYPVTLFGGNFNGTNTRLASYKLKYFKLWKAGVLVRDFIPVRDVNDTPCLYDKVSNEFFYNKGTGNFIAGPVVNE